MCADLILEPSITVSLADSLRQVEIAFNRSHTFTDKSSVQRLFFACYESHRICPESHEFSPAEALYAVFI
jgi:hypothetical protein